MQSALQATLFLLRAGQAGPILRNLASRMATRETYRPGEVLPFRPVEFPNAASELRRLYYGEIDPRRADHAAALQHAIDRIVEAFRLEPIALQATGLAPPEALRTPEQAAACAVRLAADPGASAAFGRLLSEMVRFVLDYRGRLLVLARDDLSTSPQNASVVAALLYRPPESLADALLGASLNDYWDRLVVPARRGLLGAGGLHYTQEMLRSSAAGSLVSGMLDYVSVPSSLPRAPGSPGTGIGRRFVMLARDTILCDWNAERFMAFATNYGNPRRIEMYESVGASRGRDFEPCGVPSVWLSWQRAKTPRRAGRSSSGAE